MSTSEAADLGSIPGLDQTKDFKTSFHSFCSTLSIKGYLWSCHAAW